MDTLDFSLPAMYSDPDDPAPSIAVSVPIIDSAGTLFASIHDAARFYRVSRRSVVSALRDGTPLRGMRFTFPS